MSQFDNHDGKNCLIREHDEPFVEFLLAEAIHFVHYHRWWIVRDISDNVIPELNVNREALIREILNRPSSCKNSYDKT